MEDVVGMVDERLWLDEQAIIQSAPRNTSRHLEEGLERKLWGPLEHDNWALVIDDSECYPASSMVGVARVVAEWLSLDERLIFQSVSQINKETRLPCGIACAWKTFACSTLFLLFARPKACSVASNRTPPAGVLLPSRDPPSVIFQGETVAQVRHCDTSLSSDGRNDSQQVVRTFEHDLMRNAHLLDLVLCYHVERLFYPVEDPE